MGKNFQDTIKWYDQNAHEYAKAREKRFAEKEIEEFSSYLPKGARILDAGCGTGRDAMRLFISGFKVVGIDISRGMLEIARNNYPSIQFIEGDLRKLPFKEGEFDGIWAIASLVHFETISDVEKVLSEFYRVLVPAGVIRILVKAQKGSEKTKIVFNKDSLIHRFFRYFKKEEIEELVKKAGFEIIKSEQYREIERVIQGKQGREWISILARKT